MTIAGTEEAKAQWAPVPYRQFFIAFGTATFFGVVFFCHLTSPNYTTEKI